MAENYHVREWLNKEGLHASSTISAFYGKCSYLNDETQQTVDYMEKKLTIHDCQNSIRLHQMGDETDQEFINKIRIVARVCSDFASYLEGVPNVPM